MPSFSYELAPARKDRYVLSLFLHAAVFLFVWKIAPWIPSPQMAPTRTTVSMLYTPALEQKPPALALKPVAPMISPPARKLAALIAPTIVAPSPEPKITAPKVEAQARLELARIPSPARPKLEPRVVTGTFITPVIAKPEDSKREVVAAFTGSSQPATVNKPAKQVQTGGFGDPNGIRGVSERRGPLTVAALGSFELPSGPGNGNGTGGAKGSPGTVASSGFGDVAGGGAGNRRREGTVVQAGFSPANVTAPSPKARGEGNSSLKPVEILYKPRPAYTDEARRLHVEGEVVVEVMFTARGELRVGRVVKGLGHGLDESALLAARQIRFRPALRDGVPYDSSAQVHIVFELAD